jgi:hypothetical protein
MKPTKKSHSKSLLLATAILFIFLSNTFKMGGFQLLMSMEQQKKIKRTITYIEKDHEALHETLNGILYFNGTKRQKIDLNETQKSKVVALSKKLADDFEELKTSFRSVYFAYGKDDNYKEFFDPLIEFKRNLNNSVDDIKEDYLKDLYAQSGKAENRIDTIKEYVEKAELKNEAEIDQRIKEMSIWNWLFGY